ncbi:hypothetical protein VPNG_01645 [Cytospora leucostoma]|uniref:Uncharacterized protein n=1 Tax=Cytospora leucostoma TaxID=1230097 RepID=A0A423XK59_9PEZI|nr:hypothetical protein VPNG_01645 [Cytospora leucostoma]
MARADGGTVFKVTQNQTADEKPRVDEQLSADQPRTARKSRKAGAHSHASRNTYVTVSSPTARHLVVSSLVAFADSPVVEALIIIIKAGGVQDLTEG